MRLLRVERGNGSQKRERVMVFKVLERPFERLRGLLGTRPDAAPVALVPCASVHTFGMGYRIDVAFVTHEGIVLDVWRSLPPYRVVRHSRAWIALERPHQCGPWLRVGEELSLQFLEPALAQAALA